MTPAPANALQWSGRPGHYEVYYLSLTDRGSGCGAWIRYTMLAPLPEAGGEATCSLWFMAMDPSAELVIGRKVSYPVSHLSADADPFELRLGDATLTDRGMRGAFEDVAWDLTWNPAREAYRHVHPLLERAGVAKTVLTLPHADLAVAGTLRFGGRERQLREARGGQAHLFGSKHAARWTWAHCNDFDDLDGSPRPGSFLDGVSVFVPRLGREVGPSTPVVGRLLDDDFLSTSPLRVTANQSRFGLTSWHLEARDGARRVAAQVDAPRDRLVGVTYTDPDGEQAYCYNSEVASMRVWVWDRRAGPASGWNLRETLVAPGRAHFEYAQRRPVEGLTLHVR